MQLLTLIRHAKSSWDDETLNDFDRPLNRRGEHDAPMMAQRLAEELEEPLTLMASPALRAISTARVFADVLRVPQNSIRIEPRIYEATAGTLLAIVNALPDTASHVLIFGHNPGMTDLGRRLTRELYADMPTCAVCTLQFDKPSWKDIVPGSGKIVRYRFPKESLK
jgi:phosphohistidine phosphatase